MRISKSRARSVYNELVHLGIDKSRLDYVGMSNTEPLVFPEKTNADRQRNRRVDVKITPIDL
jgi:outer membrane protein OmpA-like peptidoglycan-associated protein